MTLRFLGCQFERDSVRRTVLEAALRLPLAIFNSIYPDVKNASDSFQGIERVACAVVPPRHDDHPKTVGDQMRQPGVRTRQISFLVSNPICKVAMSISPIDDEPSYEEPQHPWQPMQP